MTDISALASQVAQFLTPLIPYLIKGGIEAGKSAAGKLGDLAAEKGWEKAATVWSRLANHKKVKKAAETVAKLPDDTDAQAALRLEIRLALAANISLAKALEKLMEEPVAARNVSASGDRSVAVGGNVIGSTIVAGDRNKVEKHRTS